MEVSGDTQVPQPEMMEQEGSTGYVSWYTQAGGVPSLGVTTEASFIVRQSGNRLTEHTEIQTTALSQYEDAT